MKNLVSKSPPSLGDVVSAVSALECQFDRVPNAVLDRIRQSRFSVRAVQKGFRESEEWNCNFSIELKYVLNSSKMN